MSPPAGAGGETRHTSFDGAEMVVGTRESPWWDLLPAFEQSQPEDNVTLSQKLNVERLVTP